jgi:hypothetical protein
MRFLSVAALAALQLSCVYANVAIKGLTTPTSFTWDDSGHVFISEKSGVIKRANSFASTAASVLLNLENQVSCFLESDHVGSKTLRVTDCHSTL